jgi:hypothetical protein
VKFSHRSFALIALLISGTLVLASPLPPEKGKEKEHDGTKVDSGSFGVFQNGHRVGTETFSIYQTNSGSVISSEFKTENAPTQDVQSSEMQLTSTGNIRRYDWKELSPEKAESVLLPNDEFLLQKWSAGPQDKEHEQPYLLSSATSILDDYFFIHREVLAWKFLGMSCKQEKGQVVCPPKQRAKFPTINPRQRNSASLSVEYLGRQTMTMKGVQLSLHTVELKSDSATWDLWLDDQWKLQRISVVGENTIVDRD